MPTPQPRQKTPGSGRRAGTPNKSTAKLRAFLAEVFEQAFQDPRFKQNLVEALVSMELDSRIFQTLCAYYAGAPPKAHVATDNVSMARLILGQVGPEDDDEDDDGAVYAPGPDGPQ